MMPHPGYPGYHPPGQPYPQPGMQPGMHPPAYPQAGMMGEDWGVPPDASGHIMGHRYGGLPAHGGMGGRGRSSRRSRSSSSSSDSRRRRRRSRSGSAGSSRSSRSSSSSRSRSRSRSRSPRPAREKRVSRFHTGPDLPAGLPPPRDLAPDSPDGRAAADEPPEEPVNSFSVPPGLLPTLCRKRHESGGKPYDPLFAEELEEAGEG